MTNERQVLELRIHGVNNTSPESMLGLESNLIEKTAGDALGSFWRPTEQGRTKSEIPDDIEREAYSWGSMARSSLGGSSGFGKVLSGLARVGWTLLLPFGLVNVAYWTRRFDKAPQQGRQPAPQLGPQPPPPATADEVDEEGWTRGHGAASLRVAGLLITLMMAVTASVIALDLIAVQCYVDLRTTAAGAVVFDPTKVCTVLPSWLDFLTGMGQARRLALLSLVPVLLIGALLVLSTATRLRYEQPDPTSLDAEAANATTTWPLLSAKGFWAHRAITRVTSRLHVAATLTLVTLSTAWHYAFGFGSECTRRGQLFGTACLEQVMAGDTRVRGEALIVVAGVLVLVLVVVSIVKRSDYAVDVPMPKNTSRTRSRTPHADIFWSDWLPLLLSIALFVIQSAVLGFTPPTVEPAVAFLMGGSATPAIILTTLLALGLSALIWRPLTDTNFRHAPVVLALVLMVLTGLLASWHSTTARWVVAALILAVVGLLLGILYARRNPYEAWGGAAPGVFVLLAALMAMLLSSAVATAAGNWFNGANSAASLADTLVPRAVERGPCPFPCITELKPPNLEVPLPYAWFGAACVPIALLFGGVIAVVVYRSLRTWSGRTTVPAGSAGAGAGLLDDPRPSVLQRRKLVAIAHRAEPMVKWLALFGTAGMMTAVALSAFGDKLQSPDRQLPEYLQASINLGMWVLAAGGLGVIGLAAGGALVGGTRPLGLAWDLMCFLPRAGHPLAPPCYAERVVPELSERCRDWLSGADGRTIVLSAHSLGSVLAVGVLLSERMLQPRTTTAQTLWVDDASLLSYGSQLRAYFGRIFPELLGTAVLGIPACRSSRLASPDPWQDEVDAANAVLPPPRPKVDRKSLLGRLGATTDVPVTPPRWKSLWRRTDYLGFPVWRYPVAPSAEQNPLDVVAAEVVTVGYLAEIQTHSDYPRTRAYETAFTELTGKASAVSTDSERDRVAELRRWEDAGATWQVVARNRHGVTVAMLRCDGGEEVDRFTSNDPRLVEFVGG